MLNRLKKRDRADAYAALVEERAQDVADSSGFILTGPVTVVRLGRLSQSADVAPDALLPSWADVS